MFPSLSERHQSQIALATRQALVQWLPTHAALNPFEIVVALDRVVLFLKQNGKASHQAGQVASLAFAWGMQLQRTLGWTWVNAGEPHFNPGLLSCDKLFLCCPVDVVTKLVMHTSQASLGSLYQRMVDGRWEGLDAVQRIQPKT